jgi:hypothetical protein
MGAPSYRAAKNAALITLAASSLATPALAAETSTINAADTAWMIVATALVLMMTIPGLALFYSGMVRKKNVLATMAQSLSAVAIISILWVAFGYSLAFVGDGPWIGTLDRWFLIGMTMESVNPAAKTIPEALFMLYQMTFAIITVALVAGAISCSPSAGSPSSMCRSHTGCGAAVSSPPWACWISPAASSCIFPPASAAWLPLWCWAGVRALAARTSRRSTCRSR